MKQIRRKRAPFYPFGPGLGKRAAMLFAEMSCAAIKRRKSRGRQGNPA
jgi:hypothetical protein